MKRNEFARLRVIFIALLPLLTSCGGTGTGNPQVTVQFGSYNAGMGFPFIRSAYASVSRVTFCFKRIRFKTDSASPVGENIDLSVGEVFFAPQNAKSLATVAIPVGVYHRVEFDLDSHCASGKSAQVANTAGNFSTTDSISIRFDGNFAVGNDTVLLLLIQDIISQLDTVTIGSDIKAKAEATGGRF